MALPTTQPNSASSPHHPIPSSSPGGRVDEVNNAVISILKNTDWPKEASNDVQHLIQTMETALKVQNLPKNTAQMPEDLKTAIEEFLQELGGVHTTLKKESEKYGTRKEGFRRGVKKLFSRANPGECIEVLRSCRTATEKSLANLNDHLSDQGAAVEQHSLHEADAETGDDPEEQNLPATASLPRSTGFDFSMDPVQSDAKPDRPMSPPEVNQPASTEAEKQKGSWRGELLSGAGKAFKFAEGVSGALPVVGSYVGAVAKVGLTVVEMVQAMDDNDETTKRLGTHVCRLSEVLERFSSQPRTSESSQTTNGMEELQRELRSVQHEIETLQAQPSIKKFWHSGDQSGSLKNLEGKVRAALEEIQLLVNLNTSILVAEIHNESMQSRHHRLLALLGDGNVRSR